MNHNIIRHNGSLAEQRVKKEIDPYCPNISMETIFMNTESSKTNEPHKFVLSLSQRLDLKNSKKHVALQNLSVYHT